MGTRRCQSTGEVLPFRIVFELTSVQRLGSSYLSALIPHMDENGLQNLHRQLSGSNVELRDLVAQLEQRSESLDDMYADVDAQPAKPPLPWRTEVKSIVQAIVEPDELSWMDDDESLSDVQYMERAFNDIEVRFQR